MNTEALANGNALALILTLFNAGAVTFKPVAIKVGARDLLDCIVVPVICNRYLHLLFIVYSSVFVQYYLLFDYSFHLH